MNKEELQLSREATIDKLAALHSHNLITKFDLQRYSKKIGKYQELSARGISLKLKILNSNHLLIYKPDGSQVYILKNSELFLFFSEDKKGNFILENLELASKPIEHLTALGMPIILKLFEWIKSGKTVAVGIHPSKNFDIDKTIDLHVLVKHKDYKPKIRIICVNGLKPASRH